MEPILSFVSIIAFIVFLIFVYMFGFVRGYAKRQQEALEKLNMFAEFLEEQEAENVIPVRIERQNDMFFVYHEKDSMFLAQGKSLEEIRDLLSKRFPGKRIIASNDNVKDVGIVS
jgi:hypothetical protein